MNTQIDAAIKVLKEGGIILYPTDTVWGLGCDATNEKAVEKIFKIKQRAVFYLGERSTLRRRMVQAGTG